MEVISKSLIETEIFATEVLGDISEIPEEEERPRVLCLHGDLGAGKTAFTQILGKLLGVKEKMQSPTYLILKSYKTSSKSEHKFFKKLIHIDAYRLEDPKELALLGFKDILKEKNTLIVIEWPEKVKGLIPKNSFNVYFEFIDENTRKMKFDLNK